MVVRFRETILTVKLILSSEIYKKFRILIEITILSFFRKLEFSRVLLIGENAVCKCVPKCPSARIAPSNIVYYCTDIDPQGKVN